MTVKQRKLHRNTGREQAKRARPQHRDFSIDVAWGKTYGRSEPPVDLFKQNFRITARSAGHTYDVSRLVTNLVWTEQGNTNFGVTGGYPISEAVTGTVTLTKPQLDQYDKLLPPFLSAQMDAAGHYSRLGALGVVFVCDLGYQGTWTPLWAMRVVPGDGSSAEQVELSDGTWTLNLADDLWLVAQSTHDFKYTKGKTAHRQGWQAHQIAMDVCRQFKIPVQTLARGTSWFELSGPLMQSTDPISVINEAYRQEAQRTGKTFVIRWAAPSRNFPFGALSVTPLRRNHNLLRFREQLTDAVLTRTQSGDFCTAVEARGTLRHASGRHRSLKHTYYSTAGIQRYGFVTKIVDFGSVSSALELKFLAQRALASRLAPIRTAELTHPGVATIRRGDAIRIDLPEEGYSDVAASIYGTPAAPPGRTGRNAYTAAQLHQAEKDDPAQFGLPDPSLLSATAQGLQISQTSDALNMNVPAVLPVADQGIAFVNYVQHTVTAGSYAMDIQTAFTDILDPKSVQDQIDLALRHHKRGKTSKGGK